jgi:hypothetical protein
MFRYQSSDENVKRRLDIGVEVRLVWLAHDKYGEIKSCASLNWKTSGSGVGIATGYGLDDLGVGVRVPVGTRIFSS